MKRYKSKASQWRDHYTRRAQKANYPARSVYKLIEIQRKYDIIHRGHAVLDLGCAPGSWLLYAAQQTGVKGRVVGVDLKPVLVTLPAHTRVITGDLNDMVEAAEQTLVPPFDVVLSDMAPATTGNKHADAFRSFMLCKTALAVADQVLRLGSAFVCKIFQGEDFNPFCDRIKARFKRMSIFKPQSSRKASREIFIIGLGKKEEGFYYGRA